jgi:TRAP transporter TAXI family solute receptor
MQKKIFMLLCIVAVILMACGPTPPPPTAAPAATATRAPVATQAPAAQPTTAPQPTQPPAAATRPKTRLAIATGPTGGVYYPYGGGFAGLVSKNVTNVEVTAEATAASVDNMKLIQSGKVDLALTLADTAYDALEGRGSFKDTGKVPVRALAVLYSNYMHIIATEESGIKTIADLKGKRVSMGAPGSGTEIKGNRVLETVGIDPEKDLKRERLTPQESAGAMKDKKLDAFFWDGGLPTAAILDLAATPGIKIRMISSNDAIAKMNEKYGPFYFKLTMPKGTYPGIDADVDVAGTANLLVVGEKFDASIAYDILKMMVEKQADLGLIHAEAKKFGLPQATVGSPIPFHAGAIKFYGEKGITVK